MDLLLADLSYLFTADCGATRVGNSTRKFQQVDGYVQQRLALFLSKRTGQHGPHRKRYAPDYFKRLGVYQLAGTVKWYTAAPIAAR